MWLEEAARALARTRPPKLTEDKLVIPGEYGETGRSMLGPSVPIPAQAPLYDPHMLLSRWPISITLSPENSSAAS